MSDIQNPFDEQIQQLQGQVPTFAISEAARKRKTQLEDLRQKSGQFNQQRADYMQKVMAEQAGIIEQKGAEKELLSHYFSGKGADEIPSELYDKAKVPRIPGKQTALPQTPEMKANGMEGGTIAPDKPATFKDVFDLGDTPIEGFYAKLPFVQSLLPEFMKDMTELSKTKMVQEGLNSRQKSKNETGNLGLRSALVSLGSKTVESLNGLLGSASNAKTAQDQGTDPEGLAFAMGDLGKRKAEYKTLSQFYNSQVKGISGIDPLPSLPDDANDPDTIQKYFNAVQPTLEKNKSLWDRMFNRNLATPGNPVEGANPNKAPSLATNGQTGNTVEKKKGLPPADGYDANSYSLLITSSPYNLSKEQAQKEILKAFPNVKKPKKKK